MTDTSTNQSTGNTSEWYTDISNTTARLSTAVSGSVAVNPSVSQTIINVISTAVICSGLLGCCCVVFGLMFNKKERKRTLNKFICNQSILDLTTCIFSLVKSIAVKTSLSTNQSGIAGGLYCYLIWNDALVSFAIYGSVAGLVVITVDRYIKIVHPVKHRRYSRPWLAKAGLALPWVNGVATAMIPNICVTKLVDGKCLTQEWPSDHVAMAVRAAMYVWRLVIPVIIFVFSYGCILSVIRRQSRLVHDGGSSQAGTSRSKDSNKSQKNVVKTMVLIVSCFIVLWFPFQTFMLLYLTGFTNLSRADREGLAAYSWLGTVAFLNVLINPIIYGSQYDVVIDTWRRVIDRIRMGKGVSKETANVGTTRTVQVSPNGTFQSASHST